MENYMRRIYLIVLLCILPTNLLAKEVIFASFNTFWLFDDKPPHMKWWSEQRGKQGQTYNEALALVAEAIRNTNADVIALQEVENIKVLKDLNNKLKTLSVEYKYLWISKGADNFTGQDVALLSKFPKFTDSNVVQSYPNEREFYLTENDIGNESDTGLSKALRVDLDINNKKLSVFVFHLKSQSGGSVSDNKRIAQASIVRRITLPLINKNESLIVLGDLNADRGSPTLLRLRGFDDIYADLIQPVHSKQFETDKWTYKYQGRTKQIDHILLSSDLRNKIASGKINYDHNYSTSDHFPIIITLEL